MVSLCSTDVAFPALSWTPTLPMFIGALPALVPFYLLLGGGCPAAVSPTFPDLHDIFQLSLQVIDSCI